MGIAPLAVKSFRNRKFSVGLAIASITLSVALLLAVELLRGEAKTGFASTVSGTDLIVGARSSGVNLLLYSVFRIGNPSNNIAWESYDTIRKLPGIVWSIPLTMGDSHRGFRVVGTDDNYFEHYRYARDRGLAMQTGAWFAGADETVLGATVAADLGYGLGDKIVVAHGAGDEHFIEHDEQPFRVVGILEPTGTPVDRTVHVSLQGFDRMHAGLASGDGGHAHDPLSAMSGGSLAREKHGDEHEEHAEHGTQDDHSEHAEHATHDDHSEHAEHATHDDHSEHAEHATQENHGEHAEHEAHDVHDGPATRNNHEEHDDHGLHGGDRAPKAISAFMLGLETRAAAIGLQRRINQFEGEPLSAILPGVALLELWEIVGLVERTLLAISLLVVLVGLSSMLIILMTSINERRREMAILRAMGARPGQVFALILGEAIAITLAGIALGIGVVAAAVLLAREWLARDFGLFIDLNLLTAGPVYVVIGVALVGCLVGLIPGISMYRYSLADGMTVRV